MNAIVTFDFEDHAVRTVTVDGEPWFVGKDVCRCLEIANHSDALARLGNDERKGVAITDPLGRNRQTAVGVNEPGIYRLVFESRKAAAERFKRWLAHEVLPQIRRTGRYAPQETPISPRMEEIELINAHVRLVAEARRVYGRAAARAMWEKGPLPQVDKPGIVLSRNSVIEPEDDGTECLAHLLRHQAGNGRTVGSLVAFAFCDGITRKAVEAMGVKIVADKKAPRIAIAERHDVLAQIFAETPWAEDWLTPLLSLDRTFVRLTGFGKRTLRAVHLPKSALAAVGY